MKFKVVMIVGLVVRFLLAPFVAHPYDVYTWYVNAESILNSTSTALSFMVPYSYSYFLFIYPAAAAFKLVSDYLGSSSTVPISSLNPLLNPGEQWNIKVVPGPIFNLLVKIPLIASDVLLAFVLRAFVKMNSDKKKTASIVALWFLNPLAIWVSSGWGMFDTLPALFTMSTLYLVTKKKFLYSGIVLAVAVALKYYAVILAIPLLILSQNAGRGRGVLWSLVGFVGTTALLFFPHINSVIGNFGFYLAGSSPNDAYYAGLSFWTTIILFYPGLNQNPLSTIIVVSGILFAYFLVAGTRFEVGQSAYSFAFAFPLAMLLLLYRFVHENFLVWLLPFAAILAIENSLLKKLYWAVSLIALLSSITVTLLPYYLLPLAPVIGKYLVDLLLIALPYRIAPSGTVIQGITIGKVVVAGFSVLYTVVLIVMVTRWSKYLTHQTR